MSSSHQIKLIYLKDISYFIRDVYSHTVNLQQSLLGEVKLGTLNKKKCGKNGVELEHHIVNPSLNIVDRSSHNGNGNGNKKINTSSTDTDNLSNDELTYTPNCSIFFDTLSQEKHAIKICDKSLREHLQDRILENPLMEIEVLQHLHDTNKNHPYFVKLVNAFEDHSSYCTILEYIPSGDLCNYVQLHGAFEYERARRYAKQITLAVEHLHNHGYCHLDLSLENILLDERTDTVKLCDFGLCRKMLPNNKPFEAASTRPGKKSYIAPEVYTYSSFYGDKADIFSLGVIYFILLCGFPPFQKPCETDACFRNIYEQDVGIILQKWQLTHVVPQEGVDLFNKIFTAEAKRISMKELLNHPFWDGLQLDDIDITPKLEMESISNTTNTSNRELSTGILSANSSNSSCNPENNVVDSINATLSESVTEVGSPESEMKYAEERPDEDYVLSSPHLDLRYTRRGDAMPQHNANCEIRKRTLSHGTSIGGNGNITADATENLMEEFGIWNLDVQSDNE